MARQSPQYSKLSRLGLKHLKPKTRKIVLIAIPLVMILGGLVVQLFPDTFSPGDDKKPTSFTTLDVFTQEHGADGSDYTQLVEPLEEPYPAEIGKVSYCDLDELERPTCAYALLTPSMRDAAAATEPQDITTDPPGWPEKNQEVTIEALPDNPGSKPYNGWFWNRSHLIADSLGGDAVVENLITGTRTQNIGSTRVEGQYSGGMAMGERAARIYLDQQTDNSCPLYYAVTPMYVDNELIPRGVQTDIISSCEDNFAVSILSLNTAQGFEIDYTTGEFRALDK